MQCLKLLSQKHNIAIITSIHQPNNDIIMMFDTLHVLAKGGLCVYSGRPKDLITHLNECGIICNEYQVPVEVLLKVASNESNDDLVIQLADKNSEERQLILNRIANETKYFPNGIEFKSKTFRFIDMWYLLLRSMTESYISQWKTLLTQIIFYMLFVMTITKMYNSDIGKPDGCFSFESNSNTTCVKQLDEDSLLNQNTKYLFFITIQAAFIQLSVTTLTFLTHVKIFVNEHQNSKFIRNYAFLLLNSNV